MFFFFFWGGGQDVVVESGHEKAFSGIYHWLLVVRTDSLGCSMNVLILGFVTWRAVKASDVHGEDV